MVDEKYIKNLLTISDDFVEDEAISKILAQSRQINIVNNRLCLCEEVSELLIEIEKDNRSGVVEELCDVILCLDCMTNYLNVKHSELKYIKEVDKEKTYVITFSKLIMLTSHIQRKRITTFEYLSYVKMIYLLIDGIVEAFNIDYKILAEMLVKKYAKFEKQLNESI